MLKLKINLIDKYRQQADSYNLNMEETSIRLNLTLNDGWYLEKWDTWFKGGYDKAIQDSINEIDDALEVIGNVEALENAKKALTELIKPADTPQTGDISNLWMWLAVILPGKDIVKRLKFTFSDKEYHKNLDRADKK